MGFAVAQPLLQFLLSEQPRRIDLHQWQTPNLVGEISDTTLAIDLDEKKKIYADLGISEYWVIDVGGKRVFAFRLQENGKYTECTESVGTAILCCSRQKIIEEPAKS
ncbi:Uma2 family endonuclease [Scytonema sp. UIC 10036]|uniref:Uma2 family endonuclease n=1 Tax=Scytonema sp. UIC 10036 TaxID=2304196 RepID=UPI001FAA6FD9|nr:Uma2 family endonuclease [Scytonema sp. UIC 10036]